MVRRKKTSGFGEKTLQNHKLLEVPNMLFSAYLEEAQTIHS